MTKFKTIKNQAARETLIGLDYILKRFRYIIKKPSTDEQTKILLEQKIVEIVEKKKVIIKQDKEDNHLDALLKDARDLLK